MLGLVLLTLNLSSNDLKIAFPMLMRLGLASLLNSKSYTILFQSSASLFKRLQFLYRDGLLTH